MSINVLGTESPAMKRRWADISLAPRSSEPELLSLPSEAEADREQLAPPPSGTLIANYRTKNNLVVAASSRTTMIKERVIISSYYETPAFSPTLERTLSEVDELSDDDKSSEEDYAGFSSPRPSQPPADAATTRSSDQVLPEIWIPDDSDDVKSSKSPGLKQKMRKGSDDVDIRSIKDKKYRHQFDNGRTRRPKKRCRQSNTKGFEIMFAVMLAIITIVMEPTTNNAPIHISSPNITFRRSNGTSPLAIEHRRHANDMLVAPTTKPNELSRKTCERLLCKLLVKLRRKRRGLVKRVTVKERMEQTKQRINTIASSVGASALATLGAKIGARLDNHLASLSIGAATSGTFVAKVQSILSRILPAFVTIGTAIGASIGAALGIKVADIVLPHLAKVRRGEKNDASSKNVSL